MSIRMISYKAFFYQYSILIMFLFLSSIISYFLAQRIIDLEKMSMPLAKNINLQNSYIQKYTDLTLSAISAYGDNDLNTVFVKRKNAQDLEKIIDDNYKTVLNLNAYLDSQKDKAVNIDNADKIKLTQQLSKANNEWQILKRMAYINLQSDIYSSIDTKYFDGFEQQKLQTTNEQASAFHFLQLGISKELTKLKTQQILALLVGFLSFLTVLIYGWFKFAKPLSYTQDEILKNQANWKKLIKTKEQEIKLEKNKALLAKKTKTDFLANMSHELRTPLNGILGVSGLLLESAIANEQKKLVEVIRKSGHSLLDILNDILDVAKIESGELALENNNFSVKQCIADLLDSLSASAKEKNIELISELEPTLPEYYIGDVGRVRQIILNILNNAIKFTKSGYVHLKVNYELLEHENIKLKFEIVDSGVGIPQEKLDHIFENFSQADEATNRSFGGVGLGLGICKFLVTMMQGNISVKSEVNVGSTFYFDIILKKGVVEDNNNAVTDKVDLDKKRILVVDDIKVNLMLLVKILQKVGCSVETASNGEEALAMYKKFPFDAILMDCHMPVMDGYEATKAIRVFEEENKKNTIPIIAITADAIVGHKEQCLDAGMNDYLTKPVRKDKLLAMLGVWLAKTTL